MYTINQLKHTEVFRYFLELSDIPRPSAHEKQAREWVISYAKKWKRQYKEDEFGNIVVFIPASTKELENAPTLAIQSHLDMVCEKDVGKEIDFFNDGLELEVVTINSTVQEEEAQWLTACGTTLGADNGIAVAMSMELMDSSSTIAHGPLELLFTLEEETGLIGAANLGNDMIQASYLLNIDNSEEDFFCIGCAGGRDFVSTMPFCSTIIGESYTPYTLIVQGLSGGHSGMEIFDGRGNALKLLEWVISEIHASYDMPISVFEGGDKRNAIPRFAQAHCWIREEEKHAIQTIINKCTSSIVLELPKIDKNLVISLQSNPTMNTRQALSTHSCKRILYLLRMCPTGVLYRTGLQSFDSTMSNNLASIKTQDGVIKIVNNCRFLTEEADKYFTRIMYGIFSDDDIQIVVENVYSAWQPQTNSKLVAFFAEKYKQMYQKDPIISSVHAGIECAVINTRVRHDLDMLSIGPNIEYLHSPKERVHIHSTLRVWNFIKQVLLQFLEIGLQK